MKKISYILSLFGGILIIIAIILINNENKESHDNSPYENNILWNMEYEKGTFNEINLVEYDSKLYKNVVINQNRVSATNYYSYVVPNSVYLNSTLDDLVKYTDNKLNVIRNSKMLNNYNADYSEDMFDNYLSNDYLNISSYKMSNGNVVYLIKTSKENNYEQILRMYIMADNGYYHVEYHLDNQKFSINFLNNVLKDNNELKNNENETSGVWKLLLDLPTPKQLTMKYDNKKYQVASELMFEDYRMILFNDLKDILIVSLLYDESSDIEKTSVLKEGFSYKMVSEELLNNYQVKTYIYHDNVDIKVYIISLDEKTKLLITTSSKHMDINDFMNFTYE